MADENQKGPLTNLVDTIDEEEQKKIAQQICTDYRRDLKSRADWEEKRDRWYKLWACHRDPKTTPWPGASNVCIPLLATAANQFQARSYQAIFAPPGMVKTIPVGEADYERAKNVEKYMNWQTLYEMEEYEEVFDKLLQLLPINGTAFKKVYYSSILERPVSEYISALDLVLPYRTKTLETARRITHRLWLHYDELVKRDDLGLYANFDKVNETPGSTPKVALEETAKKVTGEDSVSATDEPHLMLECHKDYKIGDGEMKAYIFTVDDSSQTLLRVTSREFKQGDETITLNYFTDYHFIPNPEGFYSFGFGHFLEQLNEMANTTFNQIFDAGRLSNQPFGFYGRRSGIKKRTIKLHPGMMIEVEDASQVNFPSMQRVDQVLFQVLGLVQQYVERFSSTSDYLSGREAKGTKTPTASGTLAIIEQGLVTFAVMTKRIFRSLRKELRLIMQLNHIFLPDTKEFRVMEDADNIAFPDMKKEDFKGVFDVIPIGDPSYASRGIRRQEATEKYNLLMANPLIAGSPPDAEGRQAIPPNTKAMRELTSDLLDSYDTKNKSKILPPLPEEEVTPEMENVKIMQGAQVTAKNGEDHLLHLQVHIGFMDTEFYTTMHDDYKEVLEKHIVETQAKAYEDTLQLQSVGGAGVPGLEGPPVAPPTGGAAPTPEGGIGEGPQF